ncbi:hypothetical protein BSL78_26354 [Apostichopus japonicus]|uniref:Ig-like domain-containing protein n=1 Tax=Stichopus japonicus TaxID=307972 RepID=A0A2G8JM60_STIJA|nr:hypothetical protein BSL78_26354 [Apostichopus japonicus]
MESSIFLNHVTIILFYSFLHISVNARLEKAIDVTVKGTYVAKSGVQRYTLYEKSPELTSFICTVKNVTGTLKDVKILKDGKVLGNVTNNGTTWTNTFLKNGDVNYFLGNYTCRARFSVTNSSGRQRSYTIDVIIEVVMQEESKDYYLIASSVGSRVYAGEQVAMFCDGHYVVETGRTKPTEEYDYSNYNDVTEAPCKVYLKGPSNPVIHVPFGMNQLDVTCDLRPLQFGTERESSRIIKTNLYKVAKKST